MVRPSETLTPTIYPRDKHCISRSNLDSDALKIMYRLVRFGYKAYLVGGGVRDLLLGKRPKDYDIATDATPRQVKELFRNSRIIGRRFKLVHVFFGGGKIIQVSTFRDFTDPIDVADDADSQNPKALATDNKYGNEVTDAQRRDITINGLFYDVSSFSIIDYVGGMEDLGRGIIRIIGDPNARLIEDPVRLIRVVRHAARAGFEIEPALWAAIGENRERLLTCSPMRVFEEVKKDLLSGSCLPIFRLLDQVKLLELLLPEISGDYGYLLSEGNQCAKSFEKLDLFCKDGRAPSVASVLSLVALYAFAGTPMDITVSRFESADVIPAFMKSCFTRLAVPKRDRENIDEILYYYHMLQTRRSSVRLGSLKRRNIFPELLAFYELLNIGGALDATVDFLNGETKEGEQKEEVLEESDAVEGYDSRAPKRRRRRGGRRHRRSRRGPESRRTAPQ